MGQHLPHFLLCCIWPDAKRPVSCVAVQVLDLSVRKYKFDECLDICSSS